MNSNNKNKNKKNLANPEHIAIIMDGNGRWAKKNNLVRTKGHLKGLEVARNIVICASKLNINQLTLFAFSSENWNRPKYEVNFLVGLMKDKLSKELSELCDNNIRINFLGDLSAFGKATRDKLLHWQNQSQNNQGLQLNIALNYGGRWDLVEACKKIAGLVKNEQMIIDNIDSQIISDNLSTSTIPDPDLLIRTSGEYRISNFLLWQLSYTELFFSDTLWPDFLSEEFIAIINQYVTRQRRYGLISEQVS